ncbi:MAG: hypothetical protein KC912_02540 [Proteobacteria bacterium]|nr:hypothetical protein [Pseudomonadota bacterium]
MRAQLLLLAILIGCADASESGDASWIAPFDGQTAFSPDQDLVVSMRGVAVPDDYPLNDLIQVMDLLDGGRVPGEVTLTGDTVRFSPDAPWESDRRCGWTVYDPLEIAHGPEVHLPDGTEGTAVFEVSDNIHVLDATVGEVDGSVCLLLSRPSEDALELDVWVQAAEYSLTAEVQPDSREDYALADTDAGAGVRCFESPEALAAGDAIRLQIAGTGDLFTQGPWRLELSEAPIVELLAARRRASLIPSAWEAGL